MKPLRTALFFCAAASPAFAQQPPGWSGEGSFSAGYTTGNTETRDAGVGVKAKHTGQMWTQQGEFQGDYGETDGLETKNRIAAAGQLDRILTPKWNTYGRLTYEKDEFSGFENRYFAGVGVSHKAIDNPVTQWTLEGGPGYKVDEVRAVAGTPTTAPIAASTEESLGARAASRFKHNFNERVALSNDTEVVYSSTSTQISNGIALTANVVGNLNARVSVDVRHDTNPLPDFEATDTATKFSLVYKVP
jgi:putative salt-induced outer membrane protein